VLGLLVAVALGAGCRRRSSDAVTDAGAEVRDAMIADAPAAAAGPWTVTLAARGLDAVALARMDDGGLLVRDGPYVYAIAADGKIGRLGTPADYLPFLPEGDDELGGYAARMASSILLSGSAAHPVLKVDGPPERFLSWSGSAWVATNARPPPWTVHRSDDVRAPPRDGGPPSEILPGFVATDRIAAGGAVVWIGHETTPSGGVSERDVTALIDAPGSAPRFLAVPVEDVVATATRTKPRHCEFLDAVDGGIHIACTTLWNDVEAKRFFTLHDGRWMSIPTGVHRAWMGRRSWGGHAVDAEGALWFWENVNELVRVIPTGDEQRFTLPASSPSLTAPTYHFVGIIPTAAEGDPSRREWTATTLVAAATPSDVRVVADVIPRREGDVWVTGRTSRGGHHLFRFSRANARLAGSVASPLPMMIRSDADQHNEIRNARGPRPWSGARCANVFVPFPSRGTGDAGRADDDAFYAKHKGALVEVGAELTRKKVFVEVEVVEGILDVPDRRVAGVLFLHTFPDGHEDAIGDAASRVAEILTPNPASPPAVTCSAPTVDRIIDTLKKAASYETFSGME
jgi:hypothetical protein